MSKCKRIGETETISLLTNGSDNVQCVVNFENTPDGDFENLLLGDRFGNGNISGWDQFEIQVANLNLGDSDAENFNTAKIKPSLDFLR
jgi:hypothetical protein